MIGMPGCRIWGAVVGPLAPRYERGPIAATVVRHPYLRCACGQALWHGEAWSTGTPLYVCRACNLVADRRHVS